MPRDSQDHSTELGADELASLVHDIRGSLHALRMGRELLQQLCADKNVSDVCSAMNDEERKVAQLLDRLFQAVGRQLTKRADMGGAEPEIAADKI